MGSGLDLGPRVGGGLDLGPRVGGSLDLGPCGLDASADLERG